MHLVEASAFLKITQPIVKYRLTGLHRDADGRVVAPNHIVAKVSREELAEKFLSPAPEKIVGKLLEAGEITAEEDISRNALPTIRMGFMIAERFLLPAKHFAYEKLRFKRAWLYYLTRDVRTFIDEKAEKELATIDPERFMKERRYMFYVVTKK